MTEAELAARLARDLGPLATDAGWSAAVTADQPQGHYSDAIADATAAMGIAGELVDAALSAAQVGELRDRALVGCLERLELHYSTLVDTVAGGGGATQKLGQVRLSIGQVRGRLDLRVGAAAQGVKVRGQRRPDYTAGAGDEE